MQFLYPYFLWALAAIAIPIIIHLFQFRRFKKVFFTNVRFLKEIKDETTNRNKLKNLLILLSRILAVVALVLAFAQPFIPKGDTLKSGKNQVSIFVDNSFSMTAMRNDVPLLDYGKEKARAVVKAYSEKDQFQILTHDFEGRHQRFLSQEDALSYIDEIVPTPNVQPIDRVINRQKQLLDMGSDNKISYIISDFQRTIMPVEALQDTSMEINLLPIQTHQLSNVSIDSVWFEGPIPFLNQNNRLLIKTTNNSNRNAEQVKISLSKDGQEKPVTVRDIEANTTVTDTVNISIANSGWHQGVVKVTDYPVTFDDEYFIAFNVPDTIKTLLINEGGISKYMDALFKGIQNLSVLNQNVNQLQYQQFPDYDLIILNDLRQISSGLSTELVQYLRNGGKVLMFPGQTADMNSYNSFLQSIQAGSLSSQNNSLREVYTINTEEFVFSDVYIRTASNLKLPKTQFSYDFLTSGASNMEKLLSYRDGSMYLGKFKVQDGQFYMCAAPLDTEVNDLVYNAEVFVPMVYKIAISTTKQKSLAYTITNHITVETANLRRTGDYTYKVKHGEEEFIPGQMPAGNHIILDFNDQVKKSGYYDLLLDDKLVNKLAFNYDRKESDMRIFEEKELKDIEASNPKVKVLGEVLQANMTAAITEKDQGIALWKWFVIVALCFLLVETLLIRFLKS
ncbi:MAG: BatA domain-containing protein [Chitinophagales bacterium]|nr:BatA domain-containing protein [Chitinophagales bacterium]